MLYITLVVNVSQAMALHVETPLIESTRLSKAASCKVYLKLENSQPAGSFKIRGLGLLCSEVSCLTSKPAARSDIVDDCLCILLL